MSHIMRKLRCLNWLYYVYTFETAKGDIQLSLQKGNYGQYFVLLKYYNKINTDTFRSAAMDDL